MSIASRFRAFTRLSRSIASCLFTVIWTSLSVVAQSALELHADFARPAGTIRPLHGINKGPLAPGGIIDLTESFRALALPSVRVHDCHWPNPDVVDIHAVFPDPNADPALPTSYDFTLTDEYLAAIRATGAEIIYRLGESIEHTTRKRFVHPPKDAAKWAEICLGIIRHYNEGWASGFHRGIRYWEIWNEPENRPAMWSGTDEDYFQLYRVTAKTIRARYPTLKVGGPAVGASGNFVNGEFRPTAFVTNFLATCRRESLPLDFFSWHCYTDKPAELVTRAKAIRALLDGHGFTATESHLNEWNYLPGNSWNPLARTARAEERQAYYESMAGAPGAAFLTSALLELQDAPLDVGNLFHGELGGFGLFNDHGVPAKNYHALRAFRELLATPRRVVTKGTTPGQLAAAAGLAADNKSAAILISNFAQPRNELRLTPAKLPWPGPTIVETRVVDATHSLDLISRTTNVISGTAIDLRLAAPAVALIQLRPATP